MNNVAACVNAPLHFFPDGLIKCHGGGQRHDGKMTDLVSFLAVDSCLNPA